MQTKNLKDKRRLSRKNLKRKLSFLVFLTIAGQMQFLNIEKARAFSNTYSPSDSSTGTTWTVPAGVTSITITAYGGGGGTGATDGAGATLRQPGPRGYVVATVSVTPGNSVTIHPGYRGANGHTGEKPATNYRGQLAIGSETALQISALPGSESHQKK